MQKSVLTRLVFGSFVLSIVFGPQSFLLTSTATAQEALNYSGLPVTGIHIEGGQALKPLRQQVFLSLSDIHIHYEFGNETNHDLSLPIILPFETIEARPAASYVRGDEAQNMDPNNFVGLAAQANGAKISPTLSFSLNYDGDITEQMAALGIPTNRFAPDYEDKMRALPADTVDKLKSEDLIDEEMLSRAWEWEPNWSISARYSWQQSFAAHEVTSIDIHYHPMVAFTYIGNDDIDTYISPETYCINDAFTKAFNKNPETLMASDYSIAHWLTYHWRDEKSWPGGIGEFYLQVNKSDEKTLFSSCQQGLKQTAPVQYSFAADSYKPAKNLNLLFIRLVDPD